MLNDSLRNKLVDNAIYILSSSGRVPNQESIRMVVRYAVVDPTLDIPIEVTEDEIETISKQIEAKYGLTQDFGNIIVNDDDTYKPWLANKRAIIEPYYWDRYKKYLYQESFPPKVVEVLDRVTDQILDYLQDPDIGGSWYRRGMVVGHVQSGKTANFLGLINKAADAGYKLIIILAGTIENLRQQTQGRVDEGFIGKESSGNFNHIRSLKGVGLFDSKLIPLTLTDSSIDFRKETNVDPQMYSTPTILIIKKNARILTRLADWLTKSNTDQNNKVQALPLLMIDDEADNASINVGTDHLNTPSAINANIRNILNLFQRKCYIAYTATPFANIFIDPETESEMLGHDLFPKDFIKSLDPPSNYFGPGRLFDSTSSDAGPIKIIEDIEHIIPLKHKKNLNVTDLPDSLKTAIQMHILTKAVKILRGMHKQHHSMLIHISRYVDVQEQIKDIVRTYVTTLTDNIRLYSKTSSKKDITNQHLRELFALYSGELHNLTFTWDEIKSKLLDAVATIQVYSVNSSRSSDQLNYKEYKDSGLNVIVVGGDRLSRGLTLENLTISYFYRNTSMYDTLMQMGRWFGFRTKYEDLCRVYMTFMSESYFMHISDSVEELRNELKLMEQLRKTPANFGLKVRRHPNSLLITARNKMRATEIVQVRVDLTGRLIESYATYYNCMEANHNFVTLSKIIASMVLTQQVIKNNEQNYFWSDIPINIIIEFISDYNNYPSAIATSKEPLIKYLKKIEIIYSKWDAVLVNIERNDNISAEYSNHIMPINQLGLQQRKCQILKPDGIEIGSNRRIDNNRAEIAGLTIEQLTEVKKAANCENLSKVPGHFYRQYRTKPLLMLHVVKPNILGSGNDTLPPFVAYGISFPKNNELDAETVEYSVNTVYAKQDFTIEEIEEENDAEE